jgi:hypothetical protein
VTFEAFIESLRLRHFRASEFYGECGIPDERLWHNIACTAIVVDELRASIGHPISISHPRAKYRDEAVNAAAGGTPLSQHMAFTALDIQCAAVGPKVLYRLLDKWRGQWFVAPFRFDRTPVTVAAGLIPFLPLEWRMVGPINEFRFEGGLGLYSWGCHVDTRGYRATWMG